MSEQPFSLWATHSIYEPAFFLFGALGRKNDWLVHWRDHLPRWEVWCFRGASLLVGIPVMVAVGVLRAQNKFSEFEACEESYPLNEKDRLQILKKGLAKQDEARVGASDVFATSDYAGLGVGGAILLFGLVMSLSTVLMSVAFLWCYRISKSSCGLGEGNSL